jgi:hypothetical protein
MIGEPNFESRLLDGSSLVIRGFGVGESDSEFFLLHAFSIIHNDISIDIILVMVLSFQKVV